MKCDWVVRRRTGKVQVEIIGPRCGNHGLWTMEPETARRIGEQMVHAAMSPETVLARNVATMDTETEG